MSTLRQIELTLYGLLFIGVVFIYNASIVHSQAVFNNPHRFILLHLGWVSISLIAFKLVGRIKFDKLITIAPILYISTLMLLVFLALWGVLPCQASTLFAPCKNNANRWLVLNPSPLPALPFIGELSFQPSEAAKIALILFLAFKLAKYVKSRKQQQPFSAFFIYTSIFSFLVFLEPNMSTGLLIFIIGTIQYFASGYTLKPFAFLTPILLFLALMMVILSPYRRERLLTFIGRTQKLTQATEAYQVSQVKIALGSGGFFGVGFGNSRQKYTYLPEVSTDSIFAIIGEELGYLGTLVILVAFALLLYNCIQLTKSTKTLEAKLVGIGIVAWILTQTLIHLGANSGLIPYTGVPLPFISYGGSSMLFSMIAMGILISISRSNA